MNEYSFIEKQVKSVMLGLLTFAMQDTPSRKAQ
jgi:hypothetical protein